MVKVSTMRRVDAWFGAPACLVLTALRRLGDLARGRRKPDPRSIRRILFVKLAEQGATVLAWPAIGKAIEMVGRENVFFLVFEENRFILDVMGLVPEENVITIRTDGMLTLAQDALAALRRLRTLRLDAAIDFEFFARSSAILTYLSGAQQRVGLHGFDAPAPYRGDLMTHRLHYDPQLHTSDAFLKMVEALDGGRLETCLPGGSESLQARSADWGEPPRFIPAAEELERVRTVVQRGAGTARYSPLVLLNANASDLLPLRRWPGQRYVDLARRLLDRAPEVHIAFTGAPGEAAEAESLVGEVGSERCFSLAGKTTLRDLLVLYCLADLLVTNDSGPAHFATLTPIRVITLFGPETPALFGARSSRTLIVWKNLACSPCVNAYNNRLSTCRDNRCMQEITVDEVFALACRVLGI